MATPSFSSTNLTKHRINNDPYVFDITLYNGYGDQLKTQKISPTGIKELVLEDNFYNYYQKGHIIIDNRFDAIERSVVGPNPASFIFYGDSRDYIDIKIMPTGETENMLDLNAQRFIGIWLQAAIYAIEDVATETPDVKFKKLYFWDLYYEILKEKTTYWSTTDIVENRLGVNPRNVQSQTNTTQQQAASQSVAALRQTQFASELDSINNLKAKNVINFSNSQRQIPTGEAIKAFLAAALPEDEGYPALFPTPSFETDGTVTPDPSLKTGDNNWDVGSSTAFFSTPARFKNSESLEYLLDGHVSGAESKYDMSFLRIHRFFRCFTFKTLSSYFKKALAGTDGGPLFSEVILLGGFQKDPITGDITATTQTGVPLIEFTPKQGRIQLLQSGSTLNFALEPSLGAITQKDFNSKFIHSYDSNEKEFGIDIAENNMEKIMETFQQNYVDAIKPSCWANIVPGKNRVKNKNLEHYFSVVEEDPFQRLARGRNKALYTAIFANNQVKFSVPGSTLRQAGIFVGVDREGSSPYEAFDRKFLGVYFVTEVKHIFEGNTYSNEIKCIKTYTETPVFAGQVGPNNTNINNQQIM